MRLEAVGAASLGTLRIEDEDGRTVATIAQLGSYERQEEMADTIVESVNYYTKEGGGQ